LNWRLNLELKTEKLNSIFSQLYIRASYKVQIRHNLIQAKIFAQLQNIAEAEKPALPFSLEQTQFQSQRFAIQENKPGHPVQTVGSVPAWY